MSNIIRRDNYIETHPINTVSEDTYEQVIQTNVGEDKVFFVRTKVTKHGKLTCFSASWHVKTPTGTVRCDSYSTAIKFLWKTKETI
jgi:hypothetical protein